MVQITNEAIIANGTSFLGFTASPAWVETASKPIYAKKTMVAAVSTPP